MAKHTGIRTFEIVAYITAPITCEKMDDLPSNLQDQIYKALERKSHEVCLPLAIVAVSCEIDHGDTEAGDKAFLRVVASEIVTADERDMAPLLDGFKGLLH